MSVKVSIILPCYFRPQLLEFGLKSLLHQKMPFSSEIIVLNDGLPDETEAICKKYKNSLNVRYFFTGQRNIPTPIWRVPGAVFNEGVKIAQGKYLILSSPEIYHLNVNNISWLVNPLIKNSKILTIPEGRDDDNAEVLKMLQRHQDINGYFDKMGNILNTRLPFCMGMTKEQFNLIGGFDPAFFNGYCFDDNNFIDRLLANGCSHFQTQAKIIHLFNSRKPEDRKGLADRNGQWEKNRQLYEQKKNEITPPVQKLDSSFNSAPMFKIEEKIEIGDKKHWHLNKIPKIAHFYWGEKTLPYLRFLSIWSFYKFNPDWEIRFYYPQHPYSKIDWNTHEHKFNFTGKDYFPNLKKLPIKFIEIDLQKLGFFRNISEVYKANYLEYYLLSTVGGLFSDTDILYFAPINNIPINQSKNKDVENVFSILWHGHTMGFLLASPKNEIYKYLLGKINKYLKKLKGDYQCIGTLMIDSEIGESIETISNLFHNLKVINLPAKTIYAYDISKIKNLFGDTDINLLVDYSIGSHFYGGHPLAMNYLNTINNRTLKDENAMDKIIQKTLKNKPYIDKKLTIHCVVKNEPFIYYCIKAVYPYADKILLYDTGSYDKHTLEDIETLLTEDIEKKIVFKQIPLDFDESQWTMDNLPNFIQENKDKFSVGKIRQLMIDSTDTEFFMVVDGDEVHYKQTMETIKNIILPNFPEDIYLMCTPINWFYDLEHTFTGCYTFPFSGGIYRTDKVMMNDLSPNEHHLVKETQEILCHSKYKMNWEKEVTPYAHFETLLKPHRRRDLIKPEQIQDFEGELPEVMLENNYYINRFLTEEK